MAIILFSTQETLFEQVAQFTQKKLPVLLSSGPSALAKQLETVLVDLVVVDVQGPRLSRLNFDAIGLAVLDLSVEMLLSSPGRRLVEVLAHLAADPDQALNLAFYGSALNVTGNFSEDGLIAGLNLIPRTVLVPDVQVVADLRALLATISQQQLRLLAMDGAVSVQYDQARDRVSVCGAGNVLLTAFRETPDSEQPTARLHVLTDGKISGWPL